MIVPPATIGMLGGGQLGRYAVVAARLMGYGTVVLDPDPAAPAGRVADEHLVAPYDDERRARPPRRDDARSSRPSSRTLRPTPWSGSPRTSSSPRRRRPWRSPRTASARSAFLAGLGVPTAPFAVRRRRRPASPSRRSSRPPASATTARVSAPSTTRAELDAAARRARCAVRRRAARAARRRDQRDRRPRRRRPPGHVPGRREPPRRRHPRPHRRPCPRRRRPSSPRPWRSPERSPTPWSTSACWPSRCSSAMAGCSSTSSPRGRTTAVTGRSTLRSRASSSSRCARCAGWRSGGTDLTRGAVAMVNLLGDLWAGGEPAWATVARRARRPPPPLRQGGGPPGPQDGPPHVLGDDAERGRRPRPRRCAPRLTTLMPTSLADERR